MMGAHGVRGLGLSPESRGGFLLDGLCSVPMVSEVDTPSFFLHSQNSRVLALLCLVSPSHGQRDPVSCSSPLPKYLLGAGRWGVALLVAVGINTPCWLRELSSEGWGFPRWCWVPPCCLCLQSPEVCLLETPKGHCGAHSCSPGMEGSADVRRWLSKAWATLLEWLYLESKDLLLGPFVLGGVAA